MHELLSLFEGCVLANGFITINHRGVVAITGADRHKFLQGLVSQDVMLATPERGIYAALLTPQGKFLHDLFIIETGNALWLDCEVDRASDLVQRLSRYKLRSDVAVTDISAAYGVAVAPGAAPENRIPAGAEMTDGFVFPDPRLPALGQRMIAARAQLPPDDVAATRAYNHLRLTLGVPDGSRDMVPGESILLEYNLEHLNAISFTKGCYVGQELTARTYHRALIKKRAFPVRITGACPAPGTPVMADGQIVGVMRSSQDDVGLAVMKVEAVKSKFELFCDEAALNTIPQH
jgi:hypothetical protein